MHMVTTRYKRQMIAFPSMWEQTTADAIDILLHAAEIPGVAG